MAAPTRTTTAFVALARALRGAHRAGEAGVGERLQAVPRLVGATLSGRYRGTSRGQLGWLAAAVVYTLAPVDLVPEALLGIFGLGDDALAVAWVAGRLLSESDRFLRWEQGQEPHGRGPDRATVVPGRVVRD